MKFAKIFALVVLLGCSAVVAHADGGSDPTVKINKFPSDPNCGDPSLPAGTECIQNGGTVTIDLNGTTIFDVGGDYADNLFHGLVSGRCRRLLQLLYGYFHELLHAGDGNHGGHEFVHGRPWAV